MPADRAGRLRHEHHHEVFPGIGPPVGAAGAGPREVADRAHHAHDAGRGLHRKAKAETIIGAGRIGVADQVLDLRTDLVRQHDYRLAERPARSATSRGPAPAAPTGGPIHGKTSWWCSWRKRPARSAGIIAR